MADQPKIKVAISTSEISSDNNDIKRSDSFELKIYGTISEQKEVMKNIEKLIVSHNEKVLGTGQLPLKKTETGSEDEDFPVGTARGKRKEVAAVGAGKGRK